MEFADHQRFPKRFMQGAIALGLVALIFSLYHLEAASLNIHYVLFGVLAIHLGERFTTYQQRGKGRFPAADAIIFLVMWLFDGEAAIMLAAIVALCFSLHSQRNITSLFFDAALKVLTTFLVVWTLRYSFGSLMALAQSSYWLTYLHALGLAVAVHAVIHATVRSIGELYKIKQSFWTIWSNDFLWTALPFLAGACGASLLFKLIGAIGITNVLATVASFAIIDFALRAYLKNPDLSIFKVAQAERDDFSSNDNAERFRSAFDHAAIGMALVSSEGRWLQVNRSLCEILGYTESELLTTDFLKITHPDDLGAALANVRQLLRGKIQTYQMEKRYIHKHGHEVWVNWSVSLSRDKHSQSVHLIFQLQDITDRKVAEQQLHYDAFHDALTGLPNRALFMDHLKLAVGRAQRNHDQLFAVLYLDLDRFKVINDSLGHAVGDQLLVGIARRLENSVRPGDSVARLGGDEFTILIEDIKVESEAIYIAERIQKELTQSFTFSGREVFTTVSIGIAPSSTGYERPEDILRDADTAMYRAKALGKARHEIFDKAMHARAMNLLQLETDLRRAVERQEFFLQYQPIVNLENFTLRGFEALIRWQHPERGFISPLDFIPVAEETGLIGKIGEWVLREACRQMQHWQKKFPSDPPLFISVNLSGKQFAQHDLINEVAYILSETKINPYNLKLEITESVVMENIETATEFLEQLRALGVQLSIDDFGTGYSSLSYLHRFPIDTLKIDRSFITSMSENNENTEIVRTILMLAQNLGMDVVAEGVETHEQLAILRELGCENGQGYFFSRPVSSDGAEKIIADTYLSQTPRMNINMVGNHSQASRKVVRVA